MNQTDPTRHSTAPPAGSLPPEVEAELRRRLHEGVQAPLASGATVQPPTGSGQTPSGAEDAPRTDSPSQTEERAGISLWTTTWTMLLSMAIYTQVWDWPFAVGFVLCILAHELGHAVAAWRVGVPVSPPVFIPGLGAFVRLQRPAGSDWREALIGIGGPIAGLLAGLLCLGMHHFTGNPLLQRVGFATFALNLLNLAPIIPLDGSWIVRAVDRRIWLLGLVGMIGLYAVGPLRTPLLILLVVASLPRLWQEMTSGGYVREGSEPASPTQRVTATLAYLVLCALLIWLVPQNYWSGLKGTQ